MRLDCRYKQCIDLEVLTRGQAMAIFCDYQDKGEHLMRTKNLKLGGS